MWLDVNRSVPRPESASWSMLVHPAAYGAWLPIFEPAIWLWPTKSQAEAQDDPQAEPKRSADNDCLNKPSEHM